jgi:hypothetical protein
MEVGGNNSFDFAQVFMFLQKDDSKIGFDFFFGWK